MINVELASLSFSFALGVAAFFNPCGFAMLPSYVAFYLGGTHTAAHPAASAARGVQLGLTVSAGFMVVFSIVGVVVSLIGAMIAQFIPWVAAGIGVVLVGMGVAMLLGKDVNPAWHLERPLLDWLQKADRSGLGFYFVYGLFYALASISCTLPLFLGMAIQAFSMGTLNGLVHFIAYGLGMTLMMLALSVAMALSKEALRAVLPSLMPVMRRIGAVVLIAAGVYLVYYNLIYSRLLWA